MHSTNRAIFRAFVGVTLALTAFAATACGGGDQQVRAGRSLGDGTSNVDISTPELENVDKRIDDLAARTSATTERVDRLEATVADEMGPEARTADVSLQLDSGDTYIELNERSLISVNGIRMTRDEFSGFTTTRGKTICSPAPTLALHPDADLDMGIWVLDRIYDEGCQNVDMIDAE